MPRDNPWMSKQTQEEMKTMKTTRQCMLTGMLVLMAVCAFASPAAADSYLGGDPLVTANGTYGTVDGGLWFDAYPGFNFAYTTPVTKTFSLPFNSEDIDWARLYVATYIGNMQENKPLNTTVEFDGTGLGNYKLLGSEIMNTTYTYPGLGGSGTVWINDHCNRVTSDCLMWYDVTDEIDSSNVTARVHTAHPDGSAPFDGRVKMITLVVAYNDGVGETIHYWVNQGHDISSYWDDNYIGTTTFNVGTALDGEEVGDADLTAIYLGSYNGNYTFEDTHLDWSNPKQGSYFGHQTWDVTGLIDEESNNTLKFTRNGTQSGSYSGYFKIPLVLLTVEED